MIRYYDLKEAQGAKILQQLEKGRFAVEDTYMLHEFTIPDREVFLLTSKRLLYLMYNSGEQGVRLVKCHPRESMAE